MQEDKFETSSEDWENRKYGDSLEHAEAVTFEEVNSTLESALNLKPISIRLEKGLIEDLKLIANANGVGYQPLIRDVLNRFVECEKKQIMRDLFKEELESQIEEKAGEDDPTPKAA